MQLYTVVYLHIQMRWGREPHLPQTVGRGGPQPILSWFFFLLGWSFFLLFFLVLLPPPSLPLPSWFSGRSVCRNPLSCPHLLLSPTPHCTNHLGKTCKDSQRSASSNVDACEKPSTDCCPSPWTLLLFRPCYQAAMLVCSVVRLYGRTHAHTHTHTLFIPFVLLRSRLFPIWSMAAVSIRWTRTATGNAFGVTHADRCRRAKSPPFFAAFWGVCFLFCFAFFLSCILLLSSVSLLSASSLSVNGPPVQPDFVSILSPQPPGQLTKDRHPSISCVCMCL